MNAGHAVELLRDHGFEAARVLAGTAAASLASHRALTRWQAASSLLTPAEITSENISAGAEKLDTPSEEPKKALSNVNNMLLQNALCMGHLMGFEAVKEPDIVSILTANGLYSAVSVIFRDATRALFPSPRVVSLRQRPINSPMQGKYDLVFSDPPLSPHSTSQSQNGNANVNVNNNAKPDPWTTDNFRTLVGVLCAVGVFIDAYTGHERYEPALTAGLVLMMATHWVLPVVKMKVMLGFVLAASILLDVARNYLGANRGETAVHWKDAAETGIRPWWAILVSLLHSFTFVIPAIFLTLQHRYAYSLHQRAILRKAAALGISPKKVPLATIPRIRLALYLEYTVCLAALAIGAAGYTLLESLGLWKGYPGEATFVAGVVVAAGAGMAGVRGELRAWLDYTEVWMPPAPLPVTVTPEVADDEEDATLASLRRKAE